MKGALLVLTILLSFPWPTSAADLFDPLADQHGQKVIVFGKIASKTLKFGRMGSQYLELAIDFEGRQVRVLTVTPPPCETVIVEGIWHTRGWFGGFIEERFLSAKKISWWRSK